MRVAICSKTWTTSEFWARIVATKRHITHKKRAAGAVNRSRLEFLLLCSARAPAFFLCAFLWLLVVFLLIDLALTFFDRDDPVGTDVRNFIDGAAGPTHLNLIHFRALLETEV